tara:strand:+ start:1400 stop:1690 length:291 start_codon:yes stop_codon:yes gene_type:complete
MAMKTKATKPALKDKKPMKAKRGGAVKKFGKGGSNEGTKIQKAMLDYKKDFLIKLQKEHGKKDGLRLFKEMDEMGYFRKGGAVKKMKRGGTATKKK